MKPKTFMLIAGEASGDLLAAELVSALREQSSILHPQSSPQFFGAGGTKMSAAGVELAFDMTQHAVTGLTDVLKNYFKFRRLFKQLLALAIERKPDVIIGIDFGGFNLRFGHAVKEYVRDNPFANWNPKIIQFVSPQVWASRPKRAQLLERDYDLLLSIFPFEKDWYARRAPKLRVEFVGHPMIGRIQMSESRSQKENSPPIVLLLPGSRKSEIKRHMPVLVETAREIRARAFPVRFQMVLPNDELAALATNYTKLNVYRELQEKDYDSWRHASIQCSVGNLAEVFPDATVAIASTGTVTMECAFFGVPTVTLYKTSWLTYEIGKRLITVKSLTMPNLLAGEEVYPEFIQHFATPENIAGAALELLSDESRRRKMKLQLEKIVASLGEPGAANRAATAILSLF